MAKLKTCLCSSAWRCAWMECVPHLVCHGEGLLRCPPTVLWLAVALGGGPRMLIWRTTHSRPQRVRTAWRWWLKAFWYILKASKCRIRWGLPREGVSQLWPHHQEGFSPKDPQAHFLLEVAPGEGHPPLTLPLMQEQVHGLRQVCTFVPNWSILL